MTDAPSFESISTGQELPGFDVTMDRETYFAYNRLINNLNPLHADAGYAKSIGFDDIVVAGVYTYSFVPRLVEDWLGGAGRVRSVEIRYHAPVYINTTVTYKGQVAKKRAAADGRLVEIEVRAWSAGGDELLSAMVVAQL